MQAAALAIPFITSALGSVGSGLASGLGALGSAGAVGSSIGSAIGAIPGLSSGISAATSLLGAPGNFLNGIGNGFSAGLSGVADRMPSTDLMKAATAPLIGGTANTGGSSGLPQILMTALGMMGGNGGGQRAPVAPGFMGRPISMGPLNPLALISGGQ